MRRHRHERGGGARGDVVRQALDATGMGPPSAFDFFRIACPLRSPPVLFSTMGDRGGERGGFSRGFGRGDGERGRGRGDRGDRGRGPRRAPKKDEDAPWVPTTKLGRLVQQARAQAQRRSANSGQTLASSCCASYTRTWTLLRTFPRGTRLVLAAGRGAWAGSPGRGLGLQLWSPLALWRRLDAAVRTQWRRVRCRLRAPERLDARCRGQPNRPPTAASSLCRLAPAHRRYLPFRDVLAAALSVRGSDIPVGAATALLAVIWIASRDEQPSVVLRSVQTQSRPSGSSLPCKC